MKPPIGATVEELLEKGWKKIKFAADCTPCPMCDEPWCEDCELHFGDCNCLGPTQDGVFYWTVGDVLMGKVFTE